MSEREAAGLGVPQLRGRCTCGRIVPLAAGGGLIAHRIPADRLGADAPAQFTLDESASTLLGWPLCPAGRPA